MTSGGLPMSATGIDTSANPILERDMYVEPVVAYRCWLIDNTQGGFGLRSWTKKIPWAPHREFEAACLRMSPIAMLGRNPQHETPNVHGCGIYAVKTLEQAARWFAQSGVGVIGVVKMWGRIIVCSEGFLAQFAYPAALLAPGSGVSPHTFRALAERYQIPTEWAA